MDWINTANGLITLITGGVALLGSLVGLIISIRGWWKTAKAKAKEEGARYIWDTIMAAADNAMVAIERTDLYAGDAKKAALEMVIASCKGMGIDVEPFITQLSAYIDDCIAFHNNLNEANK